MKFNSPIQFCISHWNMASALQSPKGILSHLKNPKLPTVKAVYCFNTSFIFICQNPDFRSRQEKWLVPTKLSNASCILGNGKESFFVWAFRHQKSMQKCKLPSFFLTNMMLLHHALWLGLMAPDSNISFRWFLTSSTIGSGIHLNHSLKGVSSVTFMVCSVEWVQPSSAGSNENTSWYSARSWHASSANYGAQVFKPLRSNSSNSLLHLCLIVNFGVWGSIHVSSSTCKLSGLGGLGTGSTDVNFCIIYIRLLLWYYPIIFKYAIINGYLALVLEYSSTQVLEYSSTKPKLKYLSC